MKFIKYIDEEKVGANSWCDLTSTTMKENAWEVMWLMNIHTCQQISKVKEVGSKCGLFVKENGTKRKI